MRPHLTLLASHDHHGMAMVAMRLGLRGWGEACSAWGSSLEPFGAAQSSQSRSSSTRKGWKSSGIAAPFVSPAITLCMSCAPLALTRLSM